VTGQAIWTSATPTVATVSDVPGTKGAVTAVAASGTSVITAAFGGQSGTATVTAAPAAVVSIAVAPATVSLPKGATQQLTATATYTDATTQDVTADPGTTWTSGAVGVATVSATGLVTAVATTGTATITASSGGKSGTTAVSAAPAAVTSIAVTPATATVAVGMTQQLTATATMTDGTTPDVSALATWTSSVTTVATVSTAGLVTGVGASGTTTITADYGGKQGTATITGAAKVLVSIAVAPGTASLAVGESTNLVATGTYSDASTADLTASATWTSSAPGVATVSNTAGSKGTVTALSSSATPATITAAYGGKSGTASVTVNPASVSSIAITPASPQTAVGASIPLTATATYTDGATLDVTSSATWVSGNTAVATVLDAGAKGLVTGVTAGQASISASFGGQVGTTIVTIKTVASIAVTPSTATVPAGTTTQLDATATLTGGGTQVVTEFATWTSGATAVATVSDAAGTKGLVTAVAQSGTATISATLGATGSATITAALPLVASIAVTPNPVSLAKGTTQQLTATATYTDATTGDVTQTATWSSANGAIASVTTSGTRGVVTAVETGGPVNVTATLGGQSGSTPVTVTGPVVTSVAVTPSPVSLPKGTTQQLTATATYSDLSTAVVTATWSSSAPAIVSVTSGGLAKGETVGGPVTVTATYSGQSGTAQVTTTPAALVSVAIAPASASIPLGGRQQLAATATYTDATTADVTATATWSSSVSAAAAVGDLASNKGLVTTVATGTTSVTAQFGGKSGACAVTVTDAAIVSIRIDLRNLMTNDGPGAPYVAPDMPLQTAPVQALATALYSTGQTMDVTPFATWSSTDATVATVSNAAGARGEVTTVAPGSATISAAFAGVTGMLDVSVHAPIAIWVAPFPTEVGIPVGANTGALKAMALFDDWSLQEITTTATWSSSDEGVVTVASGVPDGGKLSGVAPGSAMVSASLGGISGGAAVIVKSGAFTLTAVTVFPTSMTVTYGERSGITAIAEYSDGSAYDITELVTWTSDNPSVVTVDWEGQVAALQPFGSAVVSGTYPGYAGPIATDVTVIPGWWFDIDWPPPVPTGEKLRLRAYTYNNSTGEQIDITDYLTWTSWNPTIVDFSPVDPPGVVTAVASYDTSEWVYAEMPNGWQNSTNVQVTTAIPVSLNLSPAVLTIPMGGTGGLSANLTYSDSMVWGVGAYATWTSSDPAAVTVDAYGRITAVGAGGATITASIFGLSSSVVVDVETRAIQSIAIAPSSIVVDSGASAPVTVTATLQGGGTLDLTRFASCTAVSATGSAFLGYYTNDGYFWGEEPGTGQLIATWDSFSASAAVEVVPAPLQAVWLNYPTDSAYAGTPIQLTLYADMGPYAGAVDATEQATWSIDSTTAGTISNAAGSKGLFVGGAVAAPTSVTVSATYGGQTATAMVTVYPGAVSSLRLEVPPAPWTMKIGQQTWARLTGEIGACLAGPCAVDLTQEATWSSSNPAVADVRDEPGQKGLVSAYRRDVGSTATISAQYGGFATASATVTVFYPALTSLTIYNVDPWWEPSFWDRPCQFGTPWSWSNNLNSIFDIRYFACATYDNGRTVDVTEAASWSTTDGAVAAVSDAVGTKGIVSTLAPGPVTIQAAFAGNLASEDVTVNANTLSRLINDGGVVLAHLGVDGGGWGPNVIRARAAYTNDQGDYPVSRYLHATSRDPAIATVGALVTEPEVGLPVHGVAPGTTLVDADYRGLSFSAPVTVDARPFQATQMFVDPGSIYGGMSYWFMGPPSPGARVPTGLPVRLQLGAFDAIGLPWTASELATWSSSNPAVATVSSDAGSRGLVTTLSPGLTTITATVDGITASFELEVTSELLVSFMLSKVHDVAPVGVTLEPIQAYAISSNGTYFDVTDFVPWTNGAFAEWTGKPGEYRLVGAGTSQISVWFNGMMGNVVLVGF